MFRRKVPFELVSNPTSLSRRKAFIQRSGMMGVEIIYDQNNLIDIGIVLVSDSPQHLGEISRRPLASYPNLTVASRGSTERKSAAVAVAFIFVILALYLPDCSGKEPRGVLRNTLLVSSRHTTGRCRS